MSSNLEKTDACQSCEFQENLNLIRQVAFFSHLPIDTLKVLAYLCNRETFKPGETIFQQKEDDGQALVIISGTADLVREDGEGSTNIRTYTAGDFLGGLSLTAEMPRLFTLRAQTAIVCLILQREKFTKAMKQFPELAPKIFKAMAERIRSWERKYLAEHAKSCDTCIKAAGASIL